ncbi:DUF6130 family protein [Fictibacillus aquaticus]|uniref:DUF4399 domain-containing protein n=1 Tax=Fictibacillus aquaticus TaxID=2021314 RepID=A0A235F8F7_9BACL|nr:DUF6130 family protein [Fictibacillus aquaticus]OYD57344.1 hypothetical protein CGZ90_11725 [Fictibacillus aquaticus]
MKYVKYILFVLLASLIAGCGNDHQGLSEVDSEKEEHAEHKPFLEASAEVKGREALIKVKTDMEISKKKFGKQRKHGQGHIHMYVDQGEKQGVTSSPILLENLSPGQHEVKISLHNNDHTPYDVTEKLTFTIK